MSKFIYVFNDADKDILLAKGYYLIKRDEKKNIYVFENRNEQCFSLDSMSDIVYSDTMTF